MVRNGLQVSGMKPDQPIHVGDHALMRKPHPCGSLEWEITRVGVDIGLRCMGCGRRVLLARSEFIKRTRTLIPGVEAEPTNAERDEH